MSKSFPHSYVVCTCKQVTLGEIIYAIKEKGAKTLQDLEDITDAGSWWGSCKKQESNIGLEKMERKLEDILKKFS